MHPEEDTEVTELGVSFPTAIDLRLACLHSAVEMYKVNPTGIVIETAEKLYQWVTQDETDDIPN